MSKKSAPWNTLATTPCYQSMHQVFTRPNVIPVASSHLTRVEILPLEKDAPLPADERQYSRCTDRKSSSAVPPCAGANNPLGIRQDSEWSGPLNIWSGEHVTDRLWPKVPVGPCCPKATVGVQGRNLRGSLRARERIHTTGHKQSAAVSPERTFDRLLCSETCRTTYANNSATAAVRCRRKLSFADGGLLDHRWVLPTQSGRSR